MKAKADRAEALYVKINKKERWSTGRKYFEAIRKRRQQRLVKQ